MLQAAELLSVHQKSLQAIHSSLQRNGEPASRTGVSFLLRLHTPFSLRATPADFSLLLDFTWWRRDFDSCRLLLASPCHGTKLEAEFGEGTVSCSACSESWPAPPAMMLGEHLLQRVYKAGESAEIFSERAAATMADWLEEYTTLPPLERTVEAPALIAQLYDFLRELQSILPASQAIAFVTAVDQNVYPARKVVSENAFNELSRTTQDALTAVRD